MSNPSLPVAGAMVRGAFMVQKLWGDRNIPKDGEAGLQLHLGL
jgi:hypothetical protein